MLFVISYQLLGLVKFKSKLYLIYTKEYSLVNGIKANNH